MQIDAHSQIGNVMSASPKAARVLNRLGVDPVRYGDLTIMAACERLGLSLSDLLRNLESLLAASGSEGPPAPREWEEASRTELVDHIEVAHHGYARQAFARLGPLIEEGLRTLEDQYPQLRQIQIHFRDLQEDLLPHFQVEEEQLFPVLRAMDHGGVWPPELSGEEQVFRIVGLEHEAVTELFKNLRILTEDYALPEGSGPLLRSILLGLRDLEDDLHVHIYLENHLLFLPTLDEGR
jgi:regulator of cell morphogenesis and NO signaling